METLEERGSLSASEAARSLFATSSISDGLACSLLGRPHGRRQPDHLHRCHRLADGDASRPAAGRGRARCLRSRDDRPLRRASRMCEIGAAKVHALELVDSFQTLVNPHAALPPPIAALTGLRDEELRRAPSAAVAVTSFMRFAGDAVLVAHNARFDASFLNRELERLTGRRLAAPVLDTVGLARRLLWGGPRASLASLAFFFGTVARPCHRALPDAEATAEILIRLIGLAQERGARTVDDLYELAAPRKRRVYGKRSLAHGAPSRPGVYLFHDRNGTTLYVGRARDLRARLRSYFRSERQRPALEAAIEAVERIEWRVLGSELEAAFEELRLIRELRPPANVRNKRPDRYLYLRRRGEGIVVSQTPGPLGPITSRRQAELAARAARKRIRRRARATAPGRPPATAPREAPEPLRVPSLRGRGQAPRPDRRTRARGRATPAARAAPHLGGLPGGAGARARLAEGVLRVRGEAVRGPSASARAGGEPRGGGRACQLSHRQLRRDAHARARRRPRAPRRLRRVARLPARGASTRRRADHGPTRATVSACRVAPISSRPPTEEGLTRVQIALALVLTIVSACGLNLGYLLQHEVASSLPPLSLRRPIASLRSLLVERRWLLGFGIQVGGFVLYVVALALAPLSLVQATAAGGLESSRSWSRGSCTSRWTRLEQVGAAVSVVGLALLGLSLLDPRRGKRGDLCLGRRVARRVGGGRGPLRDAARASDRARASVGDRLRDPLRRRRRGDKDGGLRPTRERRLPRLPDRLLQRRNRRPPGRIPAGRRADHGRPLDPRRTRFRSPPAWCSSTNSSPRG